MTLFVYPIANPPQRGGKKQGKDARNPKEPH